MSKHKLCLHKQKGPIVSKGQSSPGSLIQVPTKVLLRKQLQAHTKRSHSTPLLFCAAALANTSVQAEDDGT